MTMQDVKRICTARRQDMFRKTILAIAAIGSLGVAALAPTSASAHWHGGWYGGHHGFWGPRFYYRPAYTGYYDGCLRRRVVYTPWGARVRLINVCGY
jgi:hypothetical protein